MSNLRLVLNSLSKIKEQSGEIYRQIKSSLNTRTCSENVSIFPFAQKHPLKAPGGIFSDDGLILTHLTDYLPSPEGYIETGKSAVGAIRDSVHFSVNHGVKSHEISWDFKNFAILFPMKSALKIKENQFVGGIAADFYSKGRVKIPEGAVILRFNDRMPKGKYKIKDASVIKELKRLRGVKLIETNGENMKEFTDDVIKKLGYELKDTSTPMCWGKEKLSSAYQAFNRFNKWQKSKGFIPAFHSYTPNAKVEQLIQNIMLRAATFNQWTYVKDGVLLNDSKLQVLELLEEIKIYSIKYKYPLDFDTNLIKKIIENAKTPKDALSMIKEKFGIYTSMTATDKFIKFNEFNRETQELTLFAHLARYVGGNKSMDISHDVIHKHLQKASKTTSSHLEDGANELTKVIMDFYNKLGFTE